MFPAIVGIITKSRLRHRNNANGRKHSGNRAFGSIKSATNGITKTIAFTFIGIRSSMSLFRAFKIGLTQAFTVLCAWAFIRSTGLVIQKALPMKITANNGQVGQHLFVARHTGFVGRDKAAPDLPLFLYTLRLNCGQ